MDNDEYMIASGRGLQAMGSFALAAVFFNKTVAALPFGASIMGDVVIGGVAIATSDIWLGVGLAMVIMGSVIVTLWDTEAQDWVEHCFLGVSLGKALDLQVKEIIAWLTRFEVKGWFKLPHSRQIYQRAFTFELDTGRLISGASIITLRHLRVMGKNRTLFDWTKQSKDEFDIVLGDIEYDLAEIIQEDFSERFNFVYNYSDKVCHYRQGLQYRAWCQVFIRNGKIETVQLNFEFDRDVDQVEATIVVNVMNSELQRRFSTPLRRQYKNKLGYSTAVDFSTV